MATARYESSSSAPVTSQGDSQKPHELQPLNQPASSRDVGAIEFLATNVGRKRIRRLLELGLNEHQLKLNRDYLNELDADFFQWLTATTQGGEARVRSVSKLRRESWLRKELPAGDQRVGSQAPRFLCDFLVCAVQNSLKQIALVKELNKQFRRDVAAATTLRDRREIILHYSMKLGATAQELKHDEAALGRWFDEEALTDRFFRKIGESEMRISFLLSRLAEATVHVFLRSLEFSAASAGGVRVADQTKRLKGIWERLKIEAIILASLIHEGDTRVHVAAIRAMRVILQNIPATAAAQMLSQQMLNFIDRAARQRNSEVWIQCEAISILAALSFPLAITVIRQRLQKPGRGDDIFVRQHIWKVIEKRVREFPNESLPIGVDPDNSPFVRQKMAQTLFLSETQNALQRWSELVLNDDDPKVRAAALTVGLSKQLTPQQYLYFLRLLPQVLEQEQHPFVLRVAAWSAAISAAQMLEKVKSLHGTTSTQATFAMEKIVRSQILPALLKLQESHPETTVRRWACQACERLWATLDPQVRSLIARLRPELRSIKVGRSKYLPTDWFSWIDEVSLGRIFAVLSQDDFGYDVQRSFWGMRITRGPSFGFRLWRFLFEIKRSATDKRQAHRHTVGRISTATLRAPSQITGELSQTKVPGEPLVIGTDGTWRPFLPLPDDFISVINLSWFKSKTVSLVTAQGITQITAPTSFTQRIKAASALTTRLAQYAQLRNQQGDAVNARRYLESFETLGFKIKFQPHRYRSRLRNDNQTGGGTELHCEDDTVSRFFNNAASIPWMAPFLTQLIGAALPDWMLGMLNRFASYFSSLYENSLEELVLFAGVVLTLVLLKHWWANRGFRKSRQSIPLSIGGWGTRGKSGTERLKAALMSDLGYALVSKTTGCEAMFIHNFAFGEPLEIPLFRPYDKATIWEQKNLVEIAARMKSSVFLWECMALNPDFVDVLQRQWMRDDLATITNTYPDHEDIQGPAGYNVAQTISGFVPQRSILVTSEEQMLPYVRQKCVESQTQLQTVGWLESGLIPDDILQRFPYQEHPDNIALVARMAQNVGVSKEQAFKAMADDLVPDLGVLKTHPISRVRGRRIEFTNGMSANERFGCMGNWKRLGYAEQNHLEQPTTWICGVVNNRGDRVPRSRVFASIIVNDISADCFFLIGTNLNGLRKFISQQWEQKESQLTLHTLEGKWDTAFALAALEKAAIESRQPLSQEDVTDRLVAMLKATVETSETHRDRQQTTQHREALDCVEQIAPQIRSLQKLNDMLTHLQIDKRAAESITKHYQRLCHAVSEYRALSEIIQDAPESISGTIDEKFRATMRTWFERKIVIISNSEATGEEVIERIVDEVPIGYLARIMGLQNIKGTGLDFVYRFHAWDTCHEACLATQNRSLVVAEKAIQTLVAMPVIGQLCLEQVRETIVLCRGQRQLQRADLQLLLDQLERRVAQVPPDEHDPVLNHQPKSVSATNAANAANQIRTALNEWVLEWTEQFLDVNDSIRRREKSEAIYRDLTAGRISRQRAVTELRKINNRQKGGWLKEDSRKVSDLVSKVKRGVRGRSQSSSQVAPRPRRGA